MINKKIDNCTYVRIVNNLLFCDIDGICYMNWEKTQIPVDTILNSFGDKIFYYENECLYEVLPSGTILEKFKYEPSSYIEPIEDYYLVFNRISRKEKNYKLTNNEKKVIWLDDVNWGYKIIKNMLFLFEENKVSKTRIEVKDFIWHFTIPKGFKIFGSVQFIDDVLFCIAYKDNHYQLVTGLDIETGTILYQNQYEVTNERKFISAHAYNPVDKLYYGLGDVYQIFNPKTGEIVLEKALNECDSKVIRPYVNSMYENKLWFVSGKYDDVKFGCLDLDTQEVEFIQDFPQENDEMFEAPIYHENKLYLKGIHYNQLYVFE
ncbi:hypothetical protein [Paenimyroides aestuarii]|uniref:Uncharacterized protein n=1 Tax=Paenimyroides aestuarii TaxID=2968490 RepID=A0ABY5NPG1_9FLAO|nr:hypothetical protein [Paenimyroides aestuarii]UUV20440.1 hypothetical protein NPX36_08670 [Paenimyroides aestuarii]